MSDLAIGLSAPFTSHLFASVFHPPSAPVSSEFESDRKEYSNDFLMSHDSLVFQQAWNSFGYSGPINSSVMSMHDWYHKYDKQILIRSLLWYFYAPFISAGVLQLSQNLDQEDPLDRCTFC